MSLLLAVVESEKFADGFGPFFDSESLSLLARDQKLNYKHLAVN